jgi:diadenosine tetraphosphate (Ap4A) HIT family hydrolase
MAMKSTGGEAFVMSARLAEISELVTDLPLSRVMLANDARFPWLMLIPRRANMQELFDLSATEQGMLMREITAVSRMLKELTKADKINVEAIGNATPQLHVHVVARYKTDSQWPKGYSGAILSLIRRRSANPSCPSSGLACASWGYRWGSIVDAMNGENRSIKTGVGRCQVPARAVRAWPLVARHSLGPAKSQGRTVALRDNRPALLIHDPDGHTLLLLGR